MSTPRSWDRGSRAIGSALTFAVAVALFAWLGHLLDEQLGSSPWFLIVGAMIGVVGGFLHVVHALAPDLLPFGKRSRDAEGARTPSRDPVGSPEPADSHVARRSPGSSGE